MADNFTTKDATGTSITGGADEIGGVKFPRFKIIHGADGTNDGDVSSANPLPVTVDDAATETTLAALNAKVTAVNTGAVVVSSSALPSGAATGAKQDTGNASLATIDTSTAATAASLTSIDGKVTAVNTGAVVVASSALPSGASTAAKQPALGTAGTASADVITVQGIASMTALKTDSSATTQPVSGTVTANLGTIGGAATAAKQPALGTAGSASADVITVQGVASMTALKVDASATTQPVSGTVTANAGSGTFAVSAAALPLPTSAATSTKQSDGTQKTQIVDGSGNVIGSTSNSLNVSLTSAANLTTGPAYNAPAAGTITTATGTVVLSCQQYTSLILELTGTYAGGVVVFEQQVQPGGAYYPCFGNPIVSPQTALVAGSTLATNASVSYQFTVGASINFRVRATALASGTINVFIAETTDALQYGENLALESGGNLAALVAGVNLTKINGTTIVNGGTAGSQSVGGIVANNGTINSAVNPVLVGGQAVSSENAAGTTAKLGQFVTDLVGKQIVLPYANPENFVSGAITSAMTGTTSTSLIAAPASGLRNYITQIVVSNSHASVGTDIIIQDGSGGTTLTTIPAAFAYGGAALVFPTPLRQPTTATAIYCADVTTGASVKVSATGYKGI